MPRRLINSILILLLFLAGTILGLPLSAYPLEPTDLLKKVVTIYERLQDFQARVEVKFYKNKNSPPNIKKFLYTFKKPNRVRLDLDSPNPGMVIIYPDKQGKAFVQPPGMARFLELHLSADNPLLTGESGQRIDQMGLGLLLENIRHSLTDRRRGPVEIKETNEEVRIRVLADDHFNPGMTTLYQFIFDKKSWLPVKVEESTPEGRLRRVITYETPKLNSGVPDALFQSD
jgi:outer membrane lipoprotein-sorting protein